MATKEGLENKLVACEKKLAAALAKKAKASAKVEEIKAEIRVLETERGPLVRALRVIEDADEEVLEVLNG